jgi:Fic family protein
MSRLMTLWLLYIVGYDVGRYISLEKIIDDSKETYYEALAATRGRTFTSGSTDWRFG